MGGGITSRFDWAFDRMRCENEQVTRLQWKDRSYIEWVEVDGEQVIYLHYLGLNDWYKLPWEPNQEDILALDWVKFPYGV